MDTLIFVDTNILLDFYRVRGGDTTLSLLNHLDANKASLIATGQVEMEFKKNRQRVILESLQSLKLPDWGCLTLPAFLAQTKSSQAICTAKDVIDRQLRRVQKRIDAVLRKPGIYDPVYRVAQHLFRHNSPYNLARSNEGRYRIRRLARKRFLLGYPPRKDTGFSLGDAINWEWVIECAKTHNVNVVIVSRDSDYGVKRKADPILSDWLTAEFKERVSRKRKVALTDRLAEGFKQAGIPVSGQKVEGERRAMQEIQASESVGIASGSARVEGHAQVVPLSPTLAFRFWVPTGAEQPR